MCHLVPDIAERKAEWTRCQPSELRENIQDQLNPMCFAASLWHIFREIVGGTLKSLSKKLGCSVSTIMEAIKTRVEEFFVSSLQLDALAMELEHAQSWQSFLSHYQATM